jgi:hypothetical protein
VSVVNVAGVAGIWLFAHEHRATSGTAENFIRVEYAMTVNQATVGY